MIKSIDVFSRKKEANDFDFKGKVLPGGISSTNSNNPSEKGSGIIITFEDDRKIYIYQKENSIAEDEIYIVRDEVEEVYSLNPITEVNDKPIFDKIMVGSLSGYMQVCMKTGSTFLDCFEGDIYFIRLFFHCKNNPQKMRYINIEDYDLVHIEDKKYKENYDCSPFKL